MDRNVWIRFLGETLNGIAFMMLMPFFALYLKDKVDSLVHVGIVMALSPITASFGSMIGGRIADVYGRKPIMMLSMASNGLVMLGFLFFDSFVAYAVLSALLGLCNSLFHPAASAMVADVTEPEKRTEAYGLLRMGHNIGAAIGPILGASVVAVSKNVIFIAAASSLLFYTLLVALFIQETMPQSKEKEKGEKLEVPPVWKVLLKDRVLLVYILTGIIISMGFSQTEGMLPLHFDNEMKSIFGEKNPYPYMMALNGALVVLFQFQISKWATDKPIGRMMLYGSLLFGFGLLAVGWLPQLFASAGAGIPLVMAVLLFVYALYTLGEMVMSPVQMTFVANLAPEHLRGTYMGAASLQWICGGALGPLLGGYLLEQRLGEVLFTILGAGCVVAGIVYLSLDRMVQHRAPEKQLKQSS